MPRHCGSSSPGARCVRPFSTRRGQACWYLTLEGRRPSAHMRVNLLSWRFAAMATKTVTDQSFATDVLGAEGAVLVDFWAEWCGPCRMIAPALEEISNELGEKVTVAKLNIDENPDIPGRYGVRVIPTMLLFKAAAASANWGNGFYEI